MIINKMSLLHIWKVQ